MKNIKLEKLRLILNEMFTSDAYDPNELLKKSQDLDELIAQEMKAMNTGRFNPAIDYKKEFDIIINNLSLLGNLHDSIRLVDPVHKEVLACEHGTISNMEASCYCVWNKNSICDNCISLKAYQQDDIMFKIEYTKDKRICMVTAIPITIYGRRLVAELLKDVTGKIIIAEK